MDEELFERWKASRKNRRRPRGPGPLGLIVVLFFSGLGIIVAFIVALNFMPSRVVQTAEGHVVSNDGDPDEDEPWHVKVRLDDGTTTHVDLPHGEPFRQDATIKIETHRKALGPVTVQFDKFAGYVEPPS